MGSKQYLGEDYIALTACATIARFTPQPSVNISGLENYIQRSGMRDICLYCDSIITDDNNHCPNCGAPRRENGQ